MAFGSFNAQSKDNTKKQKEKRIKEKFKEDPQINISQNDFEASESTDINILIVARDTSSIYDYLCSANENMSAALHKEGLTYYTVESETTAIMVSIKKKFERYFWEFSKERWSSPKPESEVSSFTFNICAAGNQNERINIIFHCCSYRGGASISVGMADAVWYIADGPVFDAEIMSDPYRDYLKNAMNNADSSSKPICLLLSQIEKQMHFDTDESACKLSYQAKTQLLARCRGVLSKREGARIAIIPVQIYGGIEYSGVDEAGNPELHIGRSGYYQSYIPANCQIPIMYSLATIMAIKETDYLYSASCGGIKKAIHHHYGIVKGDANWLPEML